MRQVVIFLLSSIFLVSCFNDFQKDFEKIAAPEWNPYVGLPLLTGSFTMEDYIDATSDDIKISQTEEGVVIIEYTGENVSSEYAEDLIEVPTQNFTEQIRFTSNQISDFPFTGNLNLSTNFDKDITPEPGSTDVIDSVYLKAGTLSIEIETNVRADGNINLTMNSLLSNGSPIVYSSGWTYDPNNPGSILISQDIDLNNVFGDFTKNGTATNNFNVDAVANLTFAGQPLLPTDFIRINIDIVDPRFQLVYGKFSEREFETELQSVGLGLFDSVAIEGFYLDQPKVEFNFTSSYGVPVEANIDQLDAVNSDGNVLPFSGTAINTPTEVMGPSIDDVGGTVTTSLVIDKSNSNITDIITFLPSELNYQFSGKVISPDPTSNQFVLDTSRVIGEYKVVLPLDGSVARFESEETINMGEGNEEDTDFIGESTIIVKSINGLPIKVGLEIIFLDEFENELLTLFTDESVMAPGVTDTDGFVIEASENIVEQKLTTEEAKQLLNAQKAVLRTILNTGETGTEVVKFRMTDEVSISLFIQTQLDF